MTIWEILNIEQTTNQADIKQAYAKLVSIHHPEDDPETFLQIRTAFHEAITYAKRNPITPNPLNERPIPSEHHEFVPSKKQQPPKQAFNFHEEQNPSMSDVHLVETISQSEHKIFHQIEQYVDKNQEVTEFYYSLVQLYLYPATALNSDIRTIHRFKDEWKAFLTSNYFYEKMREQEFFCVFVDYIDILHKVYRTYPQEIKKLIKKNLKYMPDDVAAIMGNVLQLKHPRIKMSDFTPVNFAKSTWLAIKCFIIMFICVIVIGGVFAAVLYFLSLIGLGVIVDFIAKNM